MYEYKIPTASEIERAVRAGGRWMDTVYPDWAKTPRLLDDMNITDQATIPVALVDPDWADKVTTNMVRDLGLHYDERLGRAVIELATKAWSQEINERAPVVKRLRMPVLQAS